MSQCKHDLYKFGVDFVYDKELKPLKKFSEFVVIFWMKLV